MVNAVDFQLGGNIKNLMEKKMRGQPDFLKQMATNEFWGTEGKNNEESLIHP